MLKPFYRNFVLKYPQAVGGLILALVLFLGYQARNLEIDASAESLVLENDKDLQLTREINQRYATQDFLIITYTPQNDLFLEETLQTLAQLEGELLQLDFVESVTSILNVPLLESPPRPIKDLLENVPTLQSPGIDKALARKEFLNSPIYQNALVSPDFKTTALQVVLKEDPIYQNLLNRRYELRAKEALAELSGAERQELETLLVDFKNHRDEARIAQSENIEKIRVLLEKYRTGDELFLGGVSMIADDLVTYVKSDLAIFGVGVLIFLIVTLWVIFRQVRWLLLPIICCSFSVTATCGLLGLFGWEVTVVSSNFISLQLIITMAITIHLIVRYRELLRLHPEAPQEELVLQAVLFMAKPCFYTALTTIAGFGSLVFSGILPIINFGWMMSVGTAISLAMSFLIFPSLLILMQKRPSNVSFESNFALTKKLAHTTEIHGKAILWGSGLLLIFSLLGISRLTVENSFIDYFKESTEIYQGMKVIDQQLGGTTPLDVVLNFQDEEIEVEPSAGTGDDEFDEFEDEFEESEGASQYWFTAEKMEQIEKVHDYLNGLSETGKVVSLGTMLKVGRTLNEGNPLDNFALALVYNELPEQFRKIILSPYVSVENNQVRFSVRVRDSDPNLRRNELIEKIRHDLQEQLGLQEEEFQLANLLILYNNMLQSLFASQILTLGAVVLALLVMFLILFRSLKIALIAIFPNVLSIGVVLGFMGWAHIPLDMMTITIAAISVGIAVDNTIHYIYRFKSEFPKDHNYTATMHRCHGSIGYAMYYTSITVIIGFSILVFSNFIPTIYFGLLTGLAMLIALIAALTLLPQLLRVIKPLGQEV